MRLQPIVDRLVAGGGADVEGALEWAGLQDAPRNTSWFVVPDAETAAASSLDAWAGAVDQRVEVGFSVIIVIPAAGRARGRAEETLHEQVEAVKKALVGWTHPAAADPTSYAGGRLLSADGRTLAWAVRFRTAYHYRKVD